MHAGQVNMSNGVTIDVVQQETGAVLLELGRAGSFMGLLLATSTRDEALAKLQQLTSLVAALPAPAPAPTTESSLIGA